MKKLVLLSIMLGIALMSFGQATPSKLVRVAARSTLVGVNLPAGTQIYCVADSTLWVVRALGLGSGASIATGSVAVPPTVNFVRTTLSVFREDTQYNIVVDSLKATEHTVVIDSANITQAGLFTKYQYNKLAGLSADAGTAFSETFEAAEDSLSIGSFQGFYTFTLTQTPKDSLAFTVSLNGVELRHHATGQYRVKTPTLAAKKILVFVPVYKYDILSVAYTK